MANDADGGAKAPRRLRIVGLVSGLALLAIVVFWQQHAAGQRRLGEALFHGQAALSAHLSSHAELLPAIASRCSNCHEQVNRLPTPASAGSTGPVAQRAVSYAPPLTSEELTQPRKRRGGPPSAYGSGEFCELLRSGTDPAHVIITTDMPRYAATNEQCQQIWAYLVDR